MMVFSHILVWVSSLLIFLAFELLFKKPIYLPGTILFLFFTVFFTVWWLAGRSVRLKFWSFLISPMFLVASELLFVISLEGRTLRQVVALTLMVFLAIFLENIYIYYNQPLKYQTHSLHNISNYINVMAVYLFAAALYWLIIFLDFPIWAAALLIWIFTILLVYQMMWIGDINFKKSWLFMVGISIIMAEIFLAIYYLPTSVYVNAIILTIVYYIITGITRNYFIKILDLKVALRYFIVGFISLTVILFTAKWS